MHGPNGVDYPNKILYTEVIKHEKLAFVPSVEDSGNRFNTIISFER